MTQLSLVDESIELDAKSHCVTQQEASDLELSGIKSPNDYGLMARVKRRAEEMKRRVSNRTKPGPAGKSKGKKNYRKNAYHYAHYPYYQRFKRPLLKRRQ